jgi:hypothetical protein
VPETPAVPVAAVAVRHGAKVTFESCTFIQNVPVARPFIDSSERTPVASVFVENAGEGETRPRVTFKNCYFQQGQVAVSVSGPADIASTDCAFGPHGSLYHLRGDGADSQATLQLHRCSAFVVYGPAFRLDGQARCTLRAEHSIFSCPDGYLGQFDPPHLIRQTATTQPAVHFHGLRNCYHNLNALWVMGFKIVTDLEDFDRQAKMAGGKGDEASTVLKESPWASPNPLAEAKKKAFAVRHDLAAVRTLDERNPLGVAWANLNPLPPLLVAQAADKLALKPNEKLVDPDATGTTPNVFPKLRQAIELANPGDVILIKPGRKSREVELEMARLGKSDIELTFRPYRDTRPILTLAETDEKDAALFRLQDGKLHFEDLEILLEPDQPFKALAMIAMVGNGHCSFKHCVLTMKGKGLGKAGEPVPLSVITLVDPDEAMKMATKSPRSAPKIEFRDCFVRGEGDLVAVRASRPFELEADNCVFGLGGSLLESRGSSDKDLPADTAAALRLSRVSAFAAEPHFLLKGNPAGKGQILTKVHNTGRCLFVSLGGKPLVFLDRLDVPEGGMDRFLDWQGTSNAYANFAKIKMVDHQRPEGSMNGPPLMKIDRDNWTEAFRYDQDPLIPEKAVRFGVSAVRPLSESRPEDFKPLEGFKAEVSGYGANLQAYELPSLKGPKTSEPVPDADETSSEISFMRSQIVGPLAACDRKY